MLNFTSAEPSEIKIDRSEVARYLGYRKSLPDGAERKLIESCITELSPHLTPRACFGVFPISHVSDCELDLGFAAVKSEKLARALGGCEKIVLFAATIGHGVDRLIQKYSSSRPSAAVTIQAIGAAAIEGFCDLLCERIAQLDGIRGEYFMRPRFSPGYGDLPLELQREIISRPDCGRILGITLSDSLLMSPSKSVSAIVGLSRENTKCTLGGCEQCEKINCSFRRN